MPVKSASVTIKTNNDFWEEVRKAAVPTAIPFGILGIEYYAMAQNRDTADYWGKLPKPNWVTDCPCIMVPIEIAVMAPIGYASHLVCEQAIGNDRKIALGLYGASLLAWLATIGVVHSTKDLSSWLGIKALGAGLFGATAIAFYKTNEKAGLLLAPITAWLAYKTIGLAATIQMNPLSKPTKPTK